MMHPTALQIEDVNDVIFFIGLAFLKKKSCNMSWGNKRKLSGLVHFLG